MVEGFIGSITLEIPWKALIVENTLVEIHGLEVTFQPRHCESADAGRCFVEKKNKYFFLVSHVIQIYKLNCNYNYTYIQPLYFIRTS